MKLVAIMSLEAYSGRLEKLYADHKVPVFSEFDIRGFRLEDTAIDKMDWFGHPKPPLYSTLTFAFVPDEKAGELLDAIEGVNQDLDTSHPIRAFQMDVERSV